MAEPDRAVCEVHIFPLKPAHFSESETTQASEKRRATGLFPQDIRRASLPEITQIAARGHLKAGLSLYGSSGKGRISSLHPFHDHFQSFILSHHASAARCAIAGFFIIPELDINFMATPKKHKRSPRHNHLLTGFISHPCLTVGIKARTPLSGRSNIISYYTILCGEEDLNFHASRH